jgi:hypothetical protein
MEDLVESLSNGNVTEVKVVLASIVALLAVYQVLLMAVGYGKVNVSFLKPKPASFVHRTLGDAIVLVTLLVAFMCIGYFEVGDGIEHALPGEEMRVTLHVIAGSLLVLFILLKVIVVRWWHAAGKFLPVLGLTVLSLYAVTWLTSAADYLWGG